MFDVHVEYLEAGVSAVQYDHYFFTFFRCLLTLEMSHLAPYQKRRLKCVQYRTMWRESLTNQEDNNCCSVK